MTVATITVNQWRIKSNAETGANEPVVCVNHYEWVEYVSDGSGKVLSRYWGPKIGEKVHYHDFVLPLGAEDVRVIYDPVNKTPCGASCWMEYEE